MIDLTARQQSAADPVHLCGRDAPRIFIEASLSLLAQSPRLHKPAQNGCLLEPLTVVRVEIGHDMMAHVQAQHIHQRERAHWPSKPIRSQCSIDLGHRGGPLLQTDRCFVEIGHQHTVHEKARALAYDDRLLAQPSRQLVDHVDDIVLRLRTGDDLDQLHHVGGVKEMHAEDVVRPARSSAHLRDRERRSIRSEDGAWWAHAA